MKAKPPTDANLTALARIYQESRLRLHESIIQTKGVGTQNYRVAILRQLEREIKSMREAGTKFAIKAVPKEYAAGVMAVKKVLSANGITKQPSLFSSIHLEAIQELVWQMNHQVGDALIQVGRRVQRYLETPIDQFLREAGLQEAAIKTATGGTVMDMKRALAEAIQNKGLLTVQYGAGASARQVRIENYATMVARTTTREAGNISRENQLTESGYDLMKLSTHHPTCAVCATLQGRVYSISGKDHRFPPLSRVFSGGYHTIHPNCRHVLVPWLEEFQAPEERKEAEARSNEPFKDPRSQEEIALYDEQQGKLRQARRDLYQYERYKALLGDEAPGTYGAFRRIKKANGQAWAELQQKYRSRTSLEPTLPWEKKVSKTLKEKIEALRAKHKLEPGKGSLDYLQDVGKLVLDDLMPTRQKVGDELRALTEEKEKLENEVLEPMRQEILNLKEALDLRAHDPDVGEKRALGDKLAQKRKLFRQYRAQGWELDRKIYDLQKGYEGDIESNSSSLKKYLSQTREMGIPEGADLQALLDSPESKEGKYVTQALDHYPTDWVRHSLREGPLVLAKSKRGSYQHFGGPGVMAIAGGDKSSLLHCCYHELGHRFEAINTNILPLEEALYQARTKDSPLQWLGAGYDKDEVSRFDKWLDKYCGKDYKGEAWELVSMGFEWAYTNPTFLWRDPEFAKFIYGILAGL